MSSGKQKLEQETQTLQKEWGAAYEQNMNQAKAAAREFGIAPEVLDTIEKAAGFSTVMKAFSKIGGAIGESKFAGGKPANAVMTPSQAVAQIGELQKDKGFIQRLYSGDMAAKDQWSKLHQFAYQGDANF